MAMVGQYQEPDGTAAPEAVAPVWNIIYSLSLLMDTGGSAKKSGGSAKKSGGTENRHFTAALTRSGTAALPECGES